MTSPSGGTDISPRQFKLLLGGLIAGLFVSSTEQSVVGTALPTMAGELGGGDQIAWVVSAYLLTSTIVTPIYGKLSDLLGRRIVYQVALVIFIGGSILCGLSQTMTQLIGARAIQGLGGGGLMSLAFIVLGDVVSPRERGRYIGVFTTVFTASAIIGPLWGGALVDNVGWRWVFFAIVPIALAAITITNRAMRLPFPTREARIDWAGGALLTVATGGLILMLIWGTEDVGWSAARTIVAGVAGTLALVLFIAQERRATEPVVPLHLFADRTIATVFAMGFFLMVGMLATFTFLPLMLQIGTGTSATRSGLMLIPQSIGISVAASVAGAVVSRWGRYKWTLVVGPVIAGTGMFLVSTLDRDLTVWQLTPTLLMLGIGLGMTFPHLTLAVQNAAELQDLGVATSGANFFRSLGGVFGAAAGGVLMTARLDDALSTQLSAARLEELGGATGLIRSPKAVAELDEELRNAVAGAVTDATTDLFLYVAPLMLGLAVLASMLKELPLRTHTAMVGRPGGSTDPASTDSASPGSAGTE